MRRVRFGWARMRGCWCGSGVCRWGVDGARCCGLRIGRGDAGELEELDLVGEEVESGGVRGEVVGGALLLGGFGELGKLCAAGTEPVGIECGEGEITAERVGDEEVFGAGVLGVAVERSTPAAWSDWMSSSRMPA